MTMKKYKKKRPFSITLLAILVLCIAVVYLARLRETLASWSSLVELLPISPGYLSLTGLVWGITGFILAFSLWFRVSWSPIVTRLVLVVFTIYYWLENIFLIDHTLRSPNWPFRTAINIIIVAWAFWILSRPGAKIYFGEIDER